MKIALDAMGGDHAPMETVKGAVEAAREYGTRVRLVGQPRPIEAELAKYDIDGLDIAIVPATEVIGMAESPATAIRRKKDSSLLVATQLVAKGEASAVVSAGNSGAVMAGALFGLSRLPGIERPALAGLMPGFECDVLLIDIGANADCKASHLVQFASMGSIYMHKVMGVREPRVGLLSIGEEDTKGNSLVKETHQLLHSTNLNFVGNIEGMDVLFGQADVIVTDGFTGNMVLKVSEGVASMLLRTIKKEIDVNLLRKAAAATLAPAFARVKERLDYAAHGGALLLGVNGVVIIGHGRSQSKAIKNAIRTAAESVEHGTVEAIRLMAEGNGHRSGVEL
jgi:phosphate acyltransferase